MSLHSLNKLKFMKKSTEKDSSCDTDTAEQSDTNNVAWKLKYRVHYPDDLQRQRKNGSVEALARRKTLSKSQTNPSALAKLSSAADPPTYINTVIRYARNPCEQCGYHDIPIMTHIPNSTSLVKSQTALEMCDVDNNRHSQALLPLEEIRHNHSSGSLMPQFLQVSRRPSVLLQDILTRYRRTDNPKPTSKLTKGIGSNGGTTLGSSVTINTNREEGGKHSIQAKQQKAKNRRHGNDALSAALSATYCKFLVLIGVCLPITEVISERINQYVYQSFYVYLYSVSVLFVIFLYLDQCRNRTLFNAVKNFHERNDNVLFKHKVTHFGSFYLRVGAIAFAIGTMVYSGLEFGQFFELHSQPGCNSIFVAITPICRMLLVIAQIQFIFLNTTYLDLGHHKILARFGLMHMVATNLCEWLYVLVEETKHEIFHIDHHAHSSSSNAAVPLTTNGLGVTVSVSGFNKTAISAPSCLRTTIMGSLVQEVAPFLFPCTIEYSLICAVMCYEMWKTIKSIPDIDKTRKHSVKPSAPKPAHQFSVDCSQSHKGLFFGILITVMTIISMIMYFVLFEQPGYLLIATQEVAIWETTMYLICGFAVCIALYLMRDLKFVNNSSDDHHSMALDNMLLVVAQTGVYVYGMFSIMGSYFSTWDTVPDRIEGIVAEIFGLVQTSLQTMFILHASHRRCKGSKQIRRKPGRELITFLLVANISLWFINTLIKGRAVFRATHLVFYGVWGWTIITHISMPLAIFYRFHSTICLFEIWKVSYKTKAH